MTIIHEDDTFQVLGEKNKYFQVIDNIQFEISCIWKVNNSKIVKGFIILVITNDVVHEDDTFISE
jgi:hypothetical protein